MFGLEVDDRAVNDILDVSRSVAAQLAASSTNEQAMAIADILGFFEVIMSIIVCPIEGTRKYQEHVQGLHILKAFLRGNYSAIFVIWTNFTFVARHNEFGAVIITAIAERSRRQ